MNLDFLFSSQLYIDLIPFVAGVGNSFLTQISKKIKIHPLIILGIISLIAGFGWNFFISYFGEEKIKEFTGFIFTSMVSSIFFYEFFIKIKKDSEKNIDDIATEKI